MSLRETLKREHKVRTGITHGGIGTGGVELGKDGVFRHWHIFNNQPFGSGPMFDWRDNSMLFFVVRYQVQGENPRMKVLQIDDGTEVAGIPNHVYTVPWLTGVDKVEYEASYPFSRLRFTDAQMPLIIDAEFFTPFIPHNVKDSSLPGMYCNFSVKSTTSKPVDVMLLATMRDGIAYDVDRKRFVTDMHEGTGYTMFEATAGLVDKKHASFGTQAMASLSKSSTHYLGWEHRHPYYEILIRNKRLPNVNDTDGRNYRLDPKTGRKHLANGRANSSIAVSRKLKGKGGFDHCFVMTWHCPNLYSDATRKQKAHGKGGERRLEGHYYSTSFKTAADVARYMIANRRRLDEQTRAFHRDFFDSSLPGYVLDQINSNLNTFVTSAWLTKDMNFGIQEGMNPEGNFGPLATIDVAMYGSLSTAALFPELDKSMMRAHKRLQMPSGEICHGIGRNFATHDAAESVHSRLDLPSQYVILALRGYFWTNDRTYLKEIWPSVVKALEYVLRERDMNGDLLPDMEGAMCTYDNFPMFGAASYVASLWLAALRYAIAAATALGDRRRAKRYSEILAHGTKVFEKKLWNGSYYRLYNDVGGKRGDKDEGCLTDQIVGQWATHFIGDAPLLKHERVKAALKTIMQHAYQPEYGLLNCRWPGDRFLHPVDPNCWSDQANTCWTGIELAFASFLIYEGFVQEGMKVVGNVDQRYRKAGMYFDHQEFGGHYFRAMSAWAIVNAALGLSINGTEFSFEPRVKGNKLKLFFVTGTGSGHYSHTRSKTSERITLDASTGSLSFGTLHLGTAKKDVSRASIKLGTRTVPAANYAVSQKGSVVTVAFDKQIVVEAGQRLNVSM